ncbi:MAG: hypothetical protein AAFU53_16540, partial [Cyanobacteria bacterium J06632_3]
RSAVPESVLTLTHATALAAGASWIYHVAPDLSVTVWSMIALGVAIAELLYHPFLRSDRLRRSTWGAGLVMSAVSYLLVLEPLTEDYGFVSYMPWLTVPIALTFIANHRHALYPKAASQLTLAALLLHLPWLHNWPDVVFSFAVATVCMGLNSRVWRSRYAVFSTVAFGLLLANSAVWHGLISTMNNSSGRMMIFWAIQIWSLWVLQRGLMQKESTVAASVDSSAIRPQYIWGTRTWGAILLSGFLLWGSVVTIFSIFSSEAALSFYADYIGYFLAATTILIFALIEFNRYQPIEWRYWCLAWAIELAVDLALLRHEISVGALGIATLVLGFIVQITADIWVSRHPESGYRASWHNIPMVYGAIALFFGHLSFEVDTGLYTLAVGLLLLGVGRRQPTLQPFGYVGLAAITAGSYELLIYQLSQASGGNPGDGFTILAVLALVTAMAYRCCGPWIQRYSRLPANGLRMVTHLHWALGSVLCISAPAETLSQPKGIAIWTVTSLLLSGYALSMGNRRWTPETTWFTHRVWTNIGLVGILLCIAYDRFVWFPDRTQLLTWGGVIACGIGFVLYSLPWRRWGWAESWQSVGLWLPLLTVSITLDHVQTLGLLVVSAFYAGMAKRTKRIRLSYWSVLLFDLTFCDFLVARGWLSTLSLGIVTGLSILYFAEVEPYFENLSRRGERHWLRLLATGLIGASALHQTEVSEATMAFAGITILIGTVFIFAGLIMKVRAYLYVGTATLMLQVLRVLWLVISANTLLVWAVGIALGLMFIWVAATFESRRSQVSSQLSSWTEALDNWD